VARYLRVSPRKVRRVGDVVKGKPVEQGLEMLRFMPQKPAAILRKIVQSAASNAQEHKGLDVDLLVIRNIIVEQGPTLKRFRPRAQGRAARILKRTSHITVVLTEGL